MKSFKFQLFLTLVLCSIAFADEAADKAEQEKAWINEVTNGYAIGKVIAKAAGCMAICHNAPPKASSGSSSGSAIASGSPFESRILSTPVGTHHFLLKPIDTSSASIHLNSKMIITNSPNFALKGTRIRKSHPRVSASNSETRELVARRKAAVIAKIERATLRAEKKMSKLPAEMQGKLRTLIRAQRDNAIADVTKLSGAMTYSVRGTIGGIGNRLAGGLGWVYQKFSGFLSNLIHAALSSGEFMDLIKKGGNMLTFYVLEQMGVSTECFTKCRAAPQRYLKTCVLEATKNQLTVDEVDSLIHGFSGGITKSLLKLSKELQDDIKMCITKFDGKLSQKDTIAQDQVITRKMRVDAVSCNFNGMVANYEAEIEKGVNKLGKELRFVPEEKVDTPRRHCFKRIFRDSSRRSSKASAVDKCLAETMARYFKSRKVDGRNGMKDLKVFTRNSRIYCERKFSSSN